MVPLVCPSGFICNSEGVYSPTQIEECPAGYVCDSATTFIDTSALTTAVPMTACPDGYYCPKGVVTNVSIYGNYSTPQPCKDGYVCDQSIFQVDFSDKAGASDQFGISECPPGSFCSRGIANSCPAGHYCSQKG